MHRLDRDHPGPAPAAAASPPSARRRRPRPGPCRPRAGRAGRAAPPDVPPRRRSRAGRRRGSRPRRPPSRARPRPRRPRRTPRRTWTTVAPSARSRATLTGGAVLRHEDRRRHTHRGRGVRVRQAGVAARRDHDPHRGSSSPDSRADSTRLKAPRALKVPVCWSSSSLNQVAPAGSQGSPGSTSCTGVRRTCGLMRRRASARSARSTPRA